MNILKLIPWKGGACPVDPRDEVLVMFSDHSYESDVAVRYNWSHGVDDHPGHIVYYAVTRQAEADLEPIVMGEAYETKDGKPVEIYRTDGGGSFPVHFGVKVSEGRWEIGYTDAFGRLKDNKPYITKAKPPYADFKIDEPVMVRQLVTKPWRKRHFAGTNENGKPLAWHNGLTSWTKELLGEDKPSAFNYCRRPIPEELERSPA